MIIFDDLPEEINEGCIILSLPKDLIAMSTTVHDVVPRIRILNS